MKLNISVAIIFTNIESKIIYAANTTEYNIKPREHIVNGFFSVWKTVLKNKKQIKYSHK